MYYFVTGFVPYATLVVSLPCTIGFYSGFYGVLIIDAHRASYCTNGTSVRRNDVAGTTAVGPQIKNDRKTKTPEKIPASLW
jgi:hypothetical protein